MGQFRQFPQNEIRTSETFLTENGFLYLAAGCIQSVRYLFIIASIWEDRPIKKKRDLEGNHTTLGCELTAVQPNFSRRIKGYISGKYIYLKKTL